MSAKTLPKVVYDRESDSFYIVLSAGFIELTPNVTVALMREAFSKSLHK